MAPVGIAVTRESFKVFEFATAWRIWVIPRAALLVSAVVASSSSVARAAVWTGVCVGADTWTGGEGVVRWPTAMASATTISPIHKKPRRALPCGAPGSVGDSAVVAAGFLRCGFSRWV